MGKQGQRKGKGGCGGRKTEEFCKLTWSMTRCKEWRREGRGRWE